ncbi:hypothetical protein TYRP_015887 [Tyrophagus putrescentiae]|nr:hypothetical protein TYRP_015887 [Tyrophagus putrescentiae]
MFGLNTLLSLFPFDRNTIISTRVHIHWNGDNFHQQPKSPADLVYGQSLTLPDLIGPSDPLDDTGLEAFARQLKQKMANVRTAESRPVHDRPEYVPADLLTCDYVYLRYNGVKTPLQRPYTGPYKVIRRSRQTVVIETSNGPTSVAIHRVKPAYVDEATMKVDMPKRRGRPRKNP